MILKDNKFDIITVNLDGYIGENAVSQDRDCSYTLSQGKKAFAQVCKNYEDKISKTSSPSVKEKCVQKLSVIRNMEQSGGKEQKRIYRFCYEIIKETPVTVKCGLPQSGVKTLGFQTGKPKKKNTQKSVVCVSDCFGLDKSFDEKEMDSFLKEYGKNETFGGLIYKFMQAKKMDATEVYNNANLSRQDFYRITKPNSGVKRSTVFNVALGLRLNVEETKRLLRSAGYALNNSTFDLIIVYCIQRNYYDIEGINYFLYERGQKSLVTNGSIKVDDGNIR